MNSADDNTTPEIIDSYHVGLTKAKTSEITVIELKDTVGDLEDCSLRSTLHEGGGNTITTENQQSMCKGFNSNDNISVL